MSGHHEIDAALRSACEAEQVAGVVAIATDAEGAIYEGAFGLRDLSGDAPMTIDTVFWIASMTKAVTAAAAMTLVEQGKLDLDVPAKRWVPGLASPKVLDGIVDGVPRLRDAKSDVTLRQLLTHTAGFVYDIWHADVGRYMEATQTPSITTCQEASLTVPLASDPGTRWEYGTNIDFVGKAVEAASGEKLGDYLRKTLFEPLGMRDTAFRIGDDQRRRLARVHARLEDGSLVPIDFELEQAPEFEMGGGGLYGTARDYAAFIRMILNDGMGPNGRVLAAETIRTMSQNQMGDLVVTTMHTANPGISNDVDLYPDQDKKWGLSFLINTKKTAEGRNAGSLAWAGLANTYYWIDPTAKVGGAIFTQLFPFGDPTVLGLFSALEAGIYASRQDASIAAGG